MSEVLLTGGVVFTVGELTAYLRSLLLQDSRLSDVWVRGEVSNSTLSRAGHLFFSLKDDSAVVKCVAWSPQSYRLRGDLIDGQEVLARGRLDLYPPQGVYQLYVEQAIPVGVGLAYLEFERVKRLLEAEGLFAQERKRALPRFPRRIGLVTSAYGAARRDVEQVIGRRWPAAEIALAPASVQGASAPDEVAAALQSLARSDVDVVIVARGGGAKEDLSCFNDERVARAICAMPVPVVTGIGHETDFTIADFVADYRAPTPSAAAAAVVPDRREMLATVAGLADRVANAISGQVRARRSELGHWSRLLAGASPQAWLRMSRAAVDDLAGHMLVAAASVHGKRQDLALLERRLQAAAPRLDGRRAAVAGHAATANALAAASLELARQQVRAMAQRLAALDPAATLRRGYAIVRHHSLFANVVTAATSLPKGAPLAIQFWDGEVLATVTRPAPPRKQQE